MTLDKFGRHISKRLKKEALDTKEIVNNVEKQIRQHISNNLNYIENKVIEQLKNEFLELKNETFPKYDDNISKLKNRCNELDPELRNITKKLKVFEENIESMHKENSEKFVTIENNITEFQQTPRASQSFLENILNKINIVELDISTLKNTLAKPHEDIDTINSKISSVTADLKNNETQLNQIFLDNKTAKENMLSKIQILDSEIKELKNTVSQFNQHTSDVKLVTNKIKMLESNVQTLNSKFIDSKADLNKKVDLIQNVSKEFKQNTDELISTIKINVSKLSVFETDAKTAIKQIKENLEANSTEINSQKKQCSDKLNELTLAVQKNENHISDLEASTDNTLKTIQNNTKAFIDNLKLEAESSLRKNILQEFDTVKQSLNKQFQEEKIKFYDDLDVLEDKFFKALDVNIRGFNAEIDKLNDSFKQTLSEQISSFQKTVMATVSLFETNYKADLKDLNDKILGLSAEYNDIYQKLSKQELDIKQLYEKIFNKLDNEEFSSKIIKRAVETNEFKNILVNENLRLEEKLKRKIKESQSVLYRKIKNLQTEINMSKKNFLPITFSGYYDKNDNSFILDTYKTSSSYEMILPEATVYKINTTDPLTIELFNHKTGKVTSFNEKNILNVSIYSGDKFKFRRGENNKNNFLNTTILFTYTI